MKAVKLTLYIADKYRWIAQQPWGQWAAFTHKPVIYVDNREDPPKRYWECPRQGHSLELTPFMDDSQKPKWEKTCRRI